MKRKMNSKRMMAIMMAAMMAMTTAAHAEELMSVDYDAAQETVAVEMVEQDNDIEMAEDASFEEEEAFMAEEETLMMEEEMPEEEAVEEAGEAEELAVFDDVELIVPSEDEELPQEEAGEKAEMAADMIDEAIAANKEEGVRAALDATFEVLSENADQLSNPESGDMEVSGDEIVEMTMDALGEHFDITTDQMVGAIGAAVLRADENGNLDALKNDDLLSSMEEEEKDAEEIVDTIRGLTKDTIEAGIDALGDVHFAFKLVAPLLKMVISPVYGGNKEENPNVMILNKMGEIETQIKNLERSMKEHMENVVVLSDLGGETGTVAKSTKVLLDRVSNIKNDDQLSSEQKLAQIAALYGTSVVTDLEKDMVGATFAFQGNSSYTLDSISVFEAAYKRACEDVMFSREAKDAMAPYIARQIAYYLEGYAVLGQVYDAYEAVYGASSLTASRDTMCENLNGVDRFGEKRGKSILQLSKNFFCLSDYIFVNKSNNTNIKLHSCLYVDTDFTKVVRKDLMTCPDYVKNNPLSDKQVQALASYCAAKNMTVFEFLVNKMYFRPAMELATSNNPKVNPFFVDWDRTTSGSKTYFSPKSSLIKGNVYLATGAQKWKIETSISFGYSEAPKYAYMQAINTTVKGAGDEKVEVYCNKIPEDSCAMMFFQRG